MELGRRQLTLLTLLHTPLQLHTNTANTVRQIKNSLELLSGKCLDIPTIQGELSSDQSESDSQVKMFYISALWAPAAPATTDLPTLSPRPAMAPTPPHTPTLHTSQNIRLSSTGIRTERENPDQVQFLRNRDKS